jgi:simple sugar transport system permease protein
MNTLPRWADLVLLPVVSLLVALLAAGAVVALVGQDPLEVIQVLVHGAFGTARGFSYTLYYAPLLSLPGWRWRWLFMAACSTLAGKGRPSWVAWVPGWWPCGGRRFCQPG